MVKQLNFLDMGKKKLRILSERRVKGIPPIKLIQDQPILMGSIRVEVDEQGQLQSYIELVLNPAYTTKSRPVE